MPMSSPLTSTRHCCPFSGTQFEIASGAQFENAEDETPYSFFVNEKEITSSLRAALDSSASEERLLTILYQPQAVFRVRAVSRCTSSLPGHAEAVLSAAFSPDGQHLASGSGDTTVRFWDVNTETPHFTCKGHKHWVLVTAWSTDGERLASGCKAGQIFIWDPKTGKQGPCHAHRSPGLPPACSLYHK
ncbi:Notchless 1 [Portunus trituberculatus]|uniref:Notchless 1 n=1 Tax=Portunus trituberculatus TaxID=210409 RepID=A0A5B7EWX5_PORTR|nr:Notchless 1 [Portunus trituberculatus]